MLNMSDNPYDQRVQLLGGEKVHGAMGSGDVMNYPHTACNTTVIPSDTQLDSSTSVTCTPCERTMREGS